MTFSIVAVDREAKEVGFAIASCCWAAGHVCMAKSGVGAIAHQSQADMSFLSQFFDRLETGEDPPDILSYFRSVDENFDVWQIGMISLGSAPLSYTGARCSPWAGHRTGDDYACQGNILVGPEVVDAMAETFEQIEGPLYARLYAALAAGDTVGGDARGRQSARLMVKSTDVSEPGTDSLIDIDVKDHPSPAEELGRVLKAWQDRAHANKLLKEIDQTPSLIEKRALLSELRAFLDDKRSDGLLTRWSMLGQAYYLLGDIDQTVDIFRTIVSIRPGYRLQIQSAAEAGEVPDELAARILAEVPDEV